MKILETPLKPEEVADLRVNEPFKVTGKIFTARDAAHEKLLDLAKKGKEAPFDLSAYPCFHCGPVMKKRGESWQVVSAGPTTSIRMEIFEDEFMEEYGTKIFVGKGGMGEKTSEALVQHGGVYAHFTGGAGSLMAGSVEEVEDVHYLEELGVPEAVWVLRVKEFGPLLVTMDSTGESIHRDISEEIDQNLQKELEKL
ncbi:FumA C-terminus/TtdB family hydratase beta subunit [Candidatus Bipolaricaulota bacterium]|nr:FumA C-terminus/TtdB family hydratase beta subunit [Candidatus Bipolaricaulota bacterium]